MATSFLVRCARSLTLTIAAAALFCAVVPSAAHASGCSDTWLNAKGGNWSEGANWSTKAPPTSEEEACITEPGTYTVTLNQSTASVKALTVGGSSGAQSLDVESTCSLNETLTTSAGLAIEARGQLTMANGDSCANSVTLAGGTLTNDGTLTAEKDAGGSRTITSNVINNGTFQVNTATSFNGTKTTLTNDGPIDVATSVALTVASGDGLDNASGGQIVAAGTGDVLVGSGGTFVESAGTTSGTLPVIVDDGTLDYEGTGASTIATRGGTTLHGTSGAKQDLIEQSTCSENATLTATGTFTNGGSMTMTNADSCANSATFVGALINDGTFTSEKAQGGSRSVQGTLTNNGTLQINASTAYNGAATTLSNQGAVKVAEAVTLTVASGDTFENVTGGSIATGPGGSVTAASSASFIEGAGTTSGATPVIVDDGALTYTGSGASAIIVRGGSKLTGATSASQSIVLESTCSENATMTIGGTFANAGSLTLTNADSCSNSETVVGTITNSGTLTSEKAVGGLRQLQGSLTNSGTLQINGNTLYNGSGTTLDNEGEVNIATGVSLTVSGQTTTNAAGKIASAGTGHLVQSGGTFNEDAGKTTGEPVYLEGGALHYTGSGASSIAARGSDTLSGEVAKGQTLTLQSTCSANAETTASSLTNSGTLILTNGDSCANYALLELGTGTLLNKGTVEVLVPAGGIRDIVGNVQNEKTLSVAAGAALKVTGTLTSTSKGTLKVGIASASSYGSITATGAATLAGSLALVVPKTFTASAGQTYGVLSAASRSGTFKTVKAAVIKIKKAAPGLYYRPVYGATTVSLDVTLATLAAEPVSGAPGSIVKLTGKGFPANDEVTPTFEDATKVKTTYPLVATNAAGEFSVEEVVPAAAAAGKGTFTTKSKQTGVSPTASYTVS